MTSISYDIKTQELAKRHGKSINHKSNFKYLMNSKTNRTYKPNNQSKENQNQSVILGSAYKFAIKKEQKLNSDEQQYQKISGPLSQIQGNITKRQNYMKDPLSQRNKPLERAQTINRKTITDESNSQLEVQSKINTDSYEDNRINEIGCMTDNCYYQKQLEIKLQLVQKEKDEIWKNISDIVKQNMILKEIVDSFTIDTKTLTIFSTQTETVESCNFACQSELSMTEIQSLDKKHLKIQSQLEQAKKLCLKIIPEQDCYDQTIEVDLKDLILETVNLNIVKASRQFEKQKEFLVKLSSQQIEKYKHYNNKLSKQMAVLTLKIQEITKTKENIKKIYEQQIEQIKNTIKNKQMSFSNQLLLMKEHLQTTNTNLEAQNKYYLQYFENTKQFINQKQKLYAQLLSQSHKTIHNLMIQMKQFQTLAQTNYYKHLKTQRSEKTIKQSHQT